MPKSQNKTNRIRNLSYRVSLHGADGGYQVGSKSPSMYVPHFRGETSQDESHKKRERECGKPLLTGVCHFKAVANIHNVNLGKQFRGFCELRQCKPKSRMFLGLLIRK